MTRPLVALAAFASLLVALPQAALASKSDLWGPERIVIRKPGNYTLRTHLVARSEDPLITIAADNVALDLNGFSLTGLGGKIGEGVVIEGRSNVKVRNGFLRRFGTGVRVSESTNVDLSGLQISGEDLPGLPPESGILLVNARGIHVAENLLARTFLGVFVRGSGSGANTIKGNTIAGGVNGQLGICYNPAPGEDGATEGPSGDVVAENHISGYRTAIQLSPASRANIFVRNYLGFFDQGFDERTPGSNTIVNNVEAALP